MHIKSICMFPRGSGKPPNIRDLHILFHESFIDKGFLSHARATCESFRGILIAIPDLTRRPFKQLSIIIPIVYTKTLCIVKAFTSFLTNDRVWYLLSSPISVIYREPLYRGLYIDLGVFGCHINAPPLPLHYYQFTVFLLNPHYKYSISKSVRHCQGSARRGDHLTDPSETLIDRGSETL